MGAKGTNSRRPTFMARVPGKGGVASASFRPASDRGAHLRVVTAENPAVSHGYAPESDDPESLAAAQAVLERATAEMKERLASSVELLRITSDRLSAEARADALEVAFLVARRIIEVEVSANVESLVSLVRSAIRRLGESRRLVIRLNPQDADAIRIILTERGQADFVTSGTVQIEIMADGGLDRGDCVVEGDVGNVDGRLGTRLEELRRALTDEAAEGAS